MSSESSNARVSADFHFFFFLSFELRVRRSQACGRTFDLIYLSFFLPHFVETRAAAAHTRTLEPLAARRANRPNLQPIASHKIYSVVGVLLSADVLALAAWMIVDPLQRRRQTFSLHEPPSGTAEDVMLRPVLEYCESENQEVWTGEWRTLVVRRLTTNRVLALILGYKCLLLVFGLFLAYESRNLKITFINDARFVCMAIYNVGLVALITGEFCARTLVLGATLFSFVFLLD